MQQRKFLSFCVIVAFVLGTSGAALRAADLPPLKNADLGMRQGQRLSYLQASATVGASGINLVPDANGRWVDIRTGHVFAEGAGTGGAGVSLFDVYEFGSPTIIKRTDFLYNTVVNAFTISGSGVLQGNTSTVDILWARPANFASVPNQNIPNFRVARLNYTLDGRVFKAIRIQQNTGNGWTQSTYDLTTGLLLIKSYAVNIPNTGTGLAFLRLTSGKRLTLPGMGTSYPASVRAFKSYNWLSKTIDTVSGAGSVTTNATATYSGLVWSTFLLKANVVINGKGAGSLQYHAGETGGVWMLPSLLNALRAGNVIDAESALGYRVSVANVSGGKITFSVQTRTAVANYQYLISNGNLLSVVGRSVEGLHTRNQSLTLTSIK